MEDTSSVDRNFRLFWLLRQTAHAMFDARQKELAQYGITTRHAAALFAIQAIGDEATPAEISRWVFREPHSVSGILSRMEKTGLVKKTKDLDKKNLIRVILTEKGRQAYRQATKRESINRVFSALAEEDRQQLESLLELLWEKALKDLGVAVKPPFP